MTLQTMPITKESYKDLKEYWDYQRKVQYNRETVFRMAEQFENRVYSDLGSVDLNTIKDQLWVRVKTDDYEDPPKNWVPEDPTLRFEWELYDRESNKTNGKWDKLTKELDDYIKSNNDDNNI